MMILETSNMVTNNIGKFALLVMLAQLLSFTEVEAETLTPRAFVYTEMQASAPFECIDWKQSNKLTALQRGLLYKTWLSGLDNNSVGGFYAFDSIENAKKYVTEFLPAQIRKQGVGYTSRIFNAAIVEEASRDMGSVDFGGKISRKPGAFVYTEVQINIPFSKVPWRQRNPILKQVPGLLAKTWLSGINTNTIGGIDAFDTIENARHYALESFPEIAAKMKAAFYVRIFDASAVRDASHEMYSPFFP